VAIRLSLGASRARLVQQFLTEALLLAALSGILGFWSAYLLLRGIVALAPVTSGLPADAHPDMLVLLFTGGLSIATATIFGLLPALSGSRSTERIVRSRGARTQPRYVLVAVEVALSLVLVASAIVLVRGLLHVSHAPRGYSAEDVTIMRLRLIQPRPEFAQNASVQYERYLEAIRAIPGVDAAAVLSGQAVPLTDANFVIDAHEGDADALARKTERLIVSPEYFRALRIPVLEGRAFTTTDTAGRPAVAIVSAEVAHYLWPHESALGKQLRVPRPTTIVGVVGDTRLSGLSAAMTPQVYVPSLQVFEPNAVLAVRTAAGIAVPVAAIKTALWSVAPEQAVFDIRTMDQLLSGAAAEPRFRASVLGAFAALALLLSTAGIFGLMSYLVSGRTRELAIRVAVGAQRHDLYWVVSKPTLISTALGLMAGFAATIAVLRLLAAGLPGVGHLDAATLGIVVVVYVVVALAATYLPARRVFAFDAMRMLKTE
jgi:putative ABC transport system permease protein